MMPKVKKGTVRDLQGHTIMNEVLPRGTCLSQPFSLGLLFVSATVTLLTNSLPFRCSTFTKRCWK